VLSAKQANRRQFVFRVWTSEAPAGEAQTIGDRTL
jgi:hypothetical protein